MTRAGEFLPDREHGVEVALQRQYDQQKPRHRNMVAHIDVPRNDVVGSRSVTALDAVSVYTPAFRVPLEDLADPLGLTDIQVRLFRRFHGLDQVRFDPDRSPAELLRAAVEGLAELRKFDAVLVGGAAAPPDLLNRAAEADVQVVTTYGMSETAGGCVYDGQPLDITDVELDTSIDDAQATVSAIIDAWNRPVDDPAFARMLRRSL